VRSRSKGTTGVITFVCRTRAGARSVFVWLAASVHVARQALPEAERELLAGLAVQDGQPDTQARFSGVALHWLLGLIRFARGDQSGALEAFERELSYEPSGHLYARECCANTWYAIGAVNLRRGDLTGAEAAFQHAMARVPMHPLARIGLAAVNNTLSDTLSPATNHPPAVPTDHQPHDASVSIDLAMARAVQLVLSGTPTDAARIVDHALAEATPGSAGWLLPVEPILCALADPVLWASALSRVRNRAA